MRRLLTTLAAVCLLSGAMGCCKHVAGMCDCDCCPYSCCGCYGCFEGCDCAAGGCAAGGCGCGVEPPPTINHAGLPGSPVAYHPGYQAPYYPQTTYPPEYVKEPPKVQPTAKTVN